MLRCHRCGWGHPSHDQACPLASGKLDESKEIALQAGWYRGRHGYRTPLNPEDPTYMLGFHKGESALEEAENGCDRAVN